MRAIRSALEQTLRDIEVIVVDDGSSDGTADEIAARFDDPRLVLVRQSHRGAAEARNAGLDQARGDLVGFLDSDDVYLPSFAAHHVTVLDASPEAAISFSDVRYLHPRWTTVGARRHPPRDIEDMLAGSWYLPVGMVVRADVARALRFDPAWLTEDTDFLFRLFAAGHRAVARTQVHSEYRADGEEGAHRSENRAQQREDMLHLQERYARYAAYPARHRVRLARGWARHLVKAGRACEARQHARTWLRARPWSLEALRYGLRILGASGAQKPARS